jgi:hypothetical protein
MTTKAQHAMSYAIAGWPVFPCEGKQALITAWQDKASTNPDQIEEWWRQWPDANIGHQPGDLSMMVLDLDPGATVEDIERSIGELPETHRVVKTPRGRHLYYLLNEDERVGPSAGRVAEHVDVRSSNSYVLLPGSTTEHGEYEWIENGGAGYRSDTMLAKAGRQRDKNEIKHENAPKVAPDLPENLAVAEAWLKYTARPAKEHEGGDHATFAAAAMMHSYGIDKDTALEMMLAHYNPRCYPPWEHHDLTVKVANAYSYPENPFGNATAGYKADLAKSIFEAVPIDRPSEYEAKRGNVRALMREGFEAIPPAKWVVEDLIMEEGYSMLFAPSDSWKSFLALDLAMTIAVGEENVIDPTFPGMVKASGHVAYIAGEGRRNMMKRAIAWEQLHLPAGQKADKFVLLDPVPQVKQKTKGGMEGDGAAAHVAVLKDLGIEQVELVILDTVGRMLQGEGDAKMEAAGGVTGLVEELRDTLGCAVLAVHHTGHENLNRPRGSSSFGGDVDNLFRIDPQPSEDRSIRTAKVVLLKNKDADGWPDPKLVKFNQIEVPGYDIGSLVAMPATSDDLPKKAPADRGKFRALQVIEKIALEIMRDRPGKVFSTRALAEQVAFHKDVEPAVESVRKYLSTLANTVGTEIRDYYDVETKSWLVKPGAKHS